FQAEDGIRDRNVTGVQTCALPIFPVRLVAGVDDRAGAGGGRGDRLPHVVAAAGEDESGRPGGVGARGGAVRGGGVLRLGAHHSRSEERRGGKEGRRRGRETDGRQR